MKPCRSLYAAHTDAKTLRDVARFDGGHSDAYTVRVFTGDGRSGARVVVPRLGNTTIWTDRKLPDEQGKPCFVRCAFCEHTHGRDDKGHWRCSRARFVLEIVESFPSLRSAPRMPWSATTFYRWARTSPSITSGSHHAAAFVLSVWDSTGPWSKGHLAFNVVRAFQSWDESHRNAFRRWAANPWWP